MFFSGGFYHVNWGEIEDKFFNHITFRGNGECEVKQVKLEASRPMADVLAVFTGGEFVFTGPEPPENAEVRIDYTIKEEERSLLTKEKWKEIEDKYGCRCSTERKHDPNGKGMPERRDNDCQKFY